MTDSELLMASPPSSSSSILIQRTTQRCGGSGTKARTTSNDADAQEGCSISQQSKDRARRRRFAGPNALTPQPSGPQRRLAFTSTMSSRA